MVVSITRPRPTSRKLLAVDLLVIDDFGLDARNATESRDAHEILTERSCRIGHRRKSGPFIHGIRQCMHESNDVR
jgi:hypothetical protein